MTTRSSGPRIFLDVTDLMRLIVAGGNPTGIPRVVSECLIPLSELVPNLVPVFFSRVSRSYCQIDGKLLAARDRGYVKRYFPARNDHLRRLYARLGVLRSGRVAPEAGDTLLIMGSSWGQGRRHGYLFGASAPPCRVIWFCHDLLPIFHPDMVMNGATFPQVFKEWLDDALDHRHEFICASRYVEADLRRYAAGKGIDDAAVTIVPLAHEFKPAEGPVRDEIRRLDGRKLALCVSSIGLRKNQIALLRVWQRLHGEFGDALPDLVVAGDFIDLMEIDEFLRKTSYVSGKVAFVGPVSDAELTWLYLACSFTVFPSLNEGWGLPVGESLWMGKPCISSGLSSLPEVGGSHAVYFDPRDEDEMMAALRPAVRGQFAALPPPRDRLRSWQQVSEDVARLLQSPPAVLYQWVDP
jgi:glycosyltransferase involved in cell wall biosynthesis